MFALNARACLLLLPAFAWSPAALAQPTTPAVSAPAASPPPTVGEITLFQSDRRVLVMMQIGDGELVPMVFDTGSDGHTIDGLLHERHRFERIGTVHEIDGTSGNERMLPQVAIPNVSLGGLRVGTIDAAVVDYHRDDAMGIISSEMFTGSLLYLDLANGRARLVPLEGAVLPDGPARAYVDAIPSIDLVMPDGSALPAHFDTGFNGALSLPVEMMDKVPLMAPARVVGRFRSISAEGEVYGGKIRGTIRIGPVTLQDPDVTFLGDRANIGLPVIRQVTLVIDPAGNRNWTLPAGTIPPPR